MRSLLRVVTVTSLSVLALVPSASAAGTVLALPGVAQMRADYAHGRYFITGGTTGANIMVVNERGAIVKTIAGELGASGMALDGGALYVARCGQAAVDVFDTATLTKTGSIPAPHLAGTCQLAFAGGRLWYGSSSQHGSLTSLAVTPPYTETVSAETLYAGGVLAATPGAPNVLATADAGLSPATFRIYDVSGPAPVETVSKRMDDTSNARDLALSPDGGTLYVAAGSPYQGRAYAVSDLSLRHSYPTDAYPTSIAVSPDGLSVAVGRTTFGALITVFHEDGSSAIGSLDLGQKGNPGLLSHALAFTADGKRVLGVVEENFDQQRALYVYNPFALVPPAMRLTVSKPVVGGGQSVVVTGQLGSWAAGRTFALYGQPVGGVKALVATVRAAATGKLTAVVRPKLRTTYTVEFAGDDVYRAAQSPGVAVAVRGVLKLRVAGSYRTVGGARLFHYSKSCWTRHVRCPAFVATLSPATGGELVRFTMQERRGRSWRTLSRGAFATDAAGRSGAEWKYLGRAWIGRTLRVQVTYAGSTALAAATAQTATFKITK